MKVNLDEIKNLDVTSLTKEELKQIVIEKTGRTLAHILAINNDNFTTEDEEILTLQDNHGFPVFYELGKNCKVDTESEKLLTTLEYKGKKYYEIYVENLLNCITSKKELRFISITAFQLYLQKYKDSEEISKRKNRIIRVIPYIILKYRDSDIQRVWEILEYKISSKTIFEYIVQESFLESVRRRFDEDKYEIYISKLESLIKSVNKVTITNLRRSSILRSLDKISRVVTKSSVVT